MDHKKVKGGFIGISRSWCKPFILMGTQTDNGSERIALTIEDAEEMIKDLQRMVTSCQLYPNGLKDNPNLIELEGLAEKCKICNGHGKIWDMDVALSGDNGFMGDCKDCKGQGYT